MSEKINGAQADSEASSGGAVVSTGHTSKGPVTIGGAIPSAPTVEQLQAELAALREENGQMNIEAQHFVSRQTAHIAELEKLGADNTRLYGVVGRMESAAKDACEVERLLREENAALKEDRAMAYDNIKMLKEERDSLRAPADALVFESADSYLEFCEWQRATHSSVSVMGSGEIFVTLDGEIQHDGTFAECFATLLAAFRASRAAVAGGGGE